MGYKCTLYLVTVEGREGSVESHRELGLGFVLNAEPLLVLKNQSSN